MNVIKDGRFSRIRELALNIRGIVNIAGISEGRSAAVAGLIAKSRGGQCLIITPSFGKAKQLAEDLSFFVGNRKIIFLQDEEHVRRIYDAKSHEILLQRLSALSIMSEGEECIVIVPASGAVKKTTPKDLFCRYRITLYAETDIDLDDLIEKLAFMGYERTPSVEAKGQFSLRGGILDIFPPSRDFPFRIELFDTIVDSIRSFDPVTQRSSEVESCAIIYPAEEMVQSEYLFSQAETRIRAEYESFAQRLSSEKRERLLGLLDKLSECIETRTNLQFLENYIHYFYETPGYIWDYLNEEGLIIVDDPNRVRETLEASEKQYKEDFKLALNKGDAAPGDYEAFSGHAAFLNIYKKHPVFLFTPFHKQVKEDDTNSLAISVISKPAPVVNGRMDFLEAELKRYAVRGYEVLIVCSTEERVQNMKHFVEKAGLHTVVKVEEGILHGGMDFPEEKLAILCDKDIFLSAKYRKSGKSSSEGRPIKAFTDIRNGDYVVHENHGIGKFLGVVQMEVQGAKSDYLKIRYAGEDLLYIPVNQMDLVQKYIASDAANPKLNKLSGSEWKKTQAKAKAAIKDMARELIALSAARSMQQGYAFSKDSLWQREFEDQFPYDETPDQLRSAQEVKRDMERHIPMDRLLCGDVGYGKTEVAARAVFKCVTEGKQAVILVPTTLLANQHYYSFKERFDSFPFQVEMLSRFRMEKQQNKILDDAKKGQIDILIGTHRLLSADVSFHDLGLLVIDEEQHFGVKHKEAIKHLRKNVDVLTLSATPIPRTLHMSLVGLRDISLIEEPPLDRYPVQTYVMEQDDELIKDAIEKEMDRNGQTFVVFNRVRGIYRIAERIADLLPNAVIAVAHGQMAERQLENIMMDFVDGKIDVLVSTTIIESGIDIQNVNTMIILDADRFGLSQLYQLRGRVGRGNRIAYAYLMYQKDKILSQTAEKRLQAIKEFTEFGAGFHIAMRDLEIRGAGNLLGSEQHGHMIMIGYELYCKLVEDAVSEMSGCTNGNDKETETSLEIDIEGYIPSTYIEDDLAKLDMYKKIASIKNEKDCKEVKEELYDRFGTIPKETANLIEIASLKALAQKARISRIHCEKNKLILNFSPKNGPTPEKLAELAGEYGNDVLIHGGSRPFIKLNLHRRSVLNEASGLLTRLVF